MSGLWSEAFEVRAARRQRAQPVPPPHRRREPGRRWSALLIALMFGLLTFGVGSVSVLGQANSYSATASLLVLPGDAGSKESVASLYDALSQGQVVESFQAVMSSSGFQRSALSGTPSNATGSGSADATTSAATSNGQRITGASITVTVVPSTSLIDVTSKASSAATAERASDAVASRAVQTLSQTFNPYRITLVSSAAGTGKQTGTGTGTLIGIVALLSVIVGVAVHQAARFIRSMRARGGPRGGLTSLK